MAVAKRGALFYACRGVLRLKNLGWRTEVEQFPEPCVYICSHSNMAGPLTTLAQLPFPVRPWVLHLFFDREDCRRQFADYTFSQRFGMPKWLAGVLARLTAGFVSALVHSAAAIPVYRGSVHLAATFEETLEALDAGDSVIIYPDVDYADHSDQIGEIYRGFLLLERFWRRRHERPLLFVPIRMDREKKRLRSERPERFDRDKPFDEEMERVRRALCRDINEEIAG